MGRPLTLVLGGARSGKSEVAEAIVAELGAPVTYVATARRSDDDPTFAARIDAHRARRPSGWATVEVAADLAGTLRTVEGAALVESLGTWVAGANAMAVDAGALCAALLERSGPTVVVSDEVGLGVVPSTEAGVAFRDALGAVNRAVAEVADEVLLVIAGRVLPLEQRG